MTIAPPSTFNRLVLEPFAERSTPDGPVTARQRRRVRLLWLGCGVAGSILGFVAPAWAALGLGLWFPGAGFLQAAAPFACLATLVLFGVSLVLWLVCGMFAAPVLVWVGSAVLAGLVAGDAAWPSMQLAVPAASIAASLFLEWRRRRAMPARLAKLRALNAHLAAVRPALPAPTWPVAAPLDAEQLGALRFTLDLALQPLDAWEGFTAKDQFREAAFRYQLYSMSWALALARATRLPSFTGVLEEAQRNACLKMTQHRVWNYWFWENLWGNFRLDADPMRHENIMVTGWYALTLGLYGVTTGDRRFDAPNALPFRHPNGRVYEYSFPRVIARLRENFDRHGLMLYPCEPNWVFNYCNENAMAGVRLFDRTHGTHHFDDLWPRFRKSLIEEFTSVEGRPTVICSNRLGVHLTSEMPVGYASSAVLRRVFDPMSAARCYEQLRLQMRPGEEELLPIGAASQVDPGCYENNGGCFAYAGLMQAAREFGDDTLYAYARRKYDEKGVQSIDGGLRWAGSTYASLLGNSGRLGAEGTWYRFGHLDYPRAWREGPCLERAAYPDVLVALAVSDGRALRLVLEPGRRPVTTTLGFGRLAPASRYRWRGSLESKVQADHLGRAQVVIELRERVECELVPEE
jgi:hypothetical protein